MAFKFSLTPDTTSGNSIRKSHLVPAATQPNNKIGTLPFGKKAWGDQTWGDGVQEWWLHVLNVDSVNVTQESWIASVHKGKKIATIKPVEDAPPPDPTPAGDFNVTVHVGEMGIYAINIEGDETKPFNIILNGRVVWP